MAYIQSHQQIAEHPKTLRLAIRLGLPKATIIGHLHLLWWWALTYAPDGDLSDHTTEQIGHAVEWAGPAQQFVDGMVDTGWLDRGPRTLRIHDWPKHHRVQEASRRSAKRPRDPYFQARRQERQAQRKAREQRQRDSARTRMRRFRERTEAGHPTSDHPADAGTRSAT